CVCGALTLFWKIVWTARPATARIPDRVTVGPGEFSQDDDSASICTLTGMGTFALTDCTPIAPSDAEAIDASGTSATENAARTSPNAIRPTLAIRFRMFSHLLTRTPTKASLISALGPT